MPSPRTRDPRVALAHVLGAACAALAACGTAPISPDAPRVVAGHVLTPYAMHEECLPLAAGDRIDYEFTATEPVDFNIHFHEGNAVVMPIVRDKSTADSGVFIARLPQDYCLMWEAGPGGALLDYRVRLRLAPR